MATILYAKDIPVEVVRARVKNLNLRVRRDGSARLSIPWHARIADAQRFLDLRADWLREHIARRTEPSPESPGQPKATYLWGEPVELPEGTDLDALYRREVAARLPEVVARMEAASGLHASGWQLRAMSSRWGSCTPATGRIRINVRLAAYPPTCLDYVVAHELTHLAEPSHNARFHELLQRAYKDEKTARALLRQRLA